MDFFEFVVGSEWPFVVGGTIVMFRHQIRRLLNHMHLKKLNVMGNEVELEPDLTNAERLAANLTSSSEMKADLTVSEAPATFVTSYVAHPGILNSPTFLHGVRVNSAWISLMAHMKMLRDRDADSHSPRLKWRESEPLQELASELGLDPSEVGAFTALETLHQRMMRTANPKITPDEAKRFEDTVGRLQRKMKLP